jgi:hypothetical protein
MKIKINIFFLLAVIGLLSNILHAQSTFSKVLYNSSLQNSLEAHSIVTTNDNGYIIAAAGGNEGLILKIDSVGDIVWNRLVNDHHPNIGPDVALLDLTTTSDSCFLLVGFIPNIATGSSSAYFIKINSNGDTLLSKMISQTDYQIFAASVQQTADSGYIMTGSAITSTNLPYDRVFAAKINSIGNLIWTVILTDGTDYTVGRSIKQTPDGGYIMTGYTESFLPYEQNAFLIKLSSNGAVSWAKKYNLDSTVTSSGNDLLIKNDGIICYLNIGGKVSLMKTDFSGNILWSKSYNFNGGSNCYGCPAPKLHETSDDEYVFVNSDCKGGKITKVDSIGNLIWTKDLSLIATDVIESKDKGFFIIGNGPLCGRMQDTTVPVIGIIKIDSLGNGQFCVSPDDSVISITDTVISSSVLFTSLTGGTENTIQPSVNPIVIIPDSRCVAVFDGIQEPKSDNEILVYPNPGTDKYYIKLPKGIDVSQASVEVYNLLGELVFITKMQNSLTSIDLSQQSSGIYIIRVNANSQSLNQRLIKQ